MIRVLHYIGLLEFGGSQAFVMEMYRNIDRNKIQFDFVTFPNQKGVLYSQILSLGGRVFESPQYNGLNHFIFISWWNHFLTNHPEYKIVHGHIRSVAAIYLPIVRKKGCFAILHSHSTSNGRGVSAFIKSILQAPVKHQADYYFACSQEAGQWLFGNKTVKGKQYRTIRNAINPERFAFNSEKRAEIRKSYHIEKAFVIGHAGRFIEAKNHVFLIDILKEALTFNKSAILFLAGDGKLQKEIKDKCRRMGLSNKVLFAGSKADIEDLYQAMDVFVFPSLWEGLGIAVIEAQASGLPCLVSKEVPDEADIGAGLVQKLDLKLGAKGWAEKALSYRKAERRSYAQEVRDAGYDIKDNVRQMQRFYLKAARKS